MQRLTRRRLLGLGASGVVGATGLLGSAGGAVGTASRQSAPWWPSERFGAGNRGGSSETEAPAEPVGVPWQYEAGTPVRTTPVFARGQFYVTVDGFLQARDLDARSYRWRQEVGGGESTPAVVDDTVYVGGDGVYALNAADGAVEWYASTAGPVRAPVTVSAVGGTPTVYAATGRGVVHAFDAADGIERWRRRTSFGLIDAPTVADGGAESGVVLVAPGETVTALRVADGAELWTYAAPGDVLGTTAYGQEQVLVGAGTAVDWLSLSGGDRVQRNLFDTSLAAPPTAIGEGVVVPYGNRVSILDSGGDPVFDQEPVLDAEAATAVSIAGGNGMLLLADTEGRVYGFRISPGSDPRWTYDTGGPVRSPPALGSGRALVPSGEHVLLLDPSWADRTAQVTSVPPPESTRTAREAPPATSHPTVTTTAPAGGGTAGGETPTRAVTEANPDPSQTIPLPEGLPVVPLSGATLVGAAALAALVKRTASDDDADGSDSSRSGGSGGSSGAAGRSGPTGASPGGGSTTGGGTTGGGTTGRGSPAPSDSETGSTTSGATTAGSAGGVGTLPYPVGDPNNRPTSVTRTPDLDLSYGDLDRGDRIGTGGNADVYHATAPGPEGPVELAVKEPRMEGTLHTETVERVAREAETWAELDDHDHVVGVVDWGSQPFPWIAMEYMDAGHLDGWLDAEPSLVERLWVGYGVVKGVRHAHRHGVAHLDLKPENVLFRSTGAETWPVPKVADWGLSRHLLEHSDTVEGLTPAYAAPEQFDDSFGPTDNVTDVYQLGAVLYEVFTGQPPFEGPASQVMHGVLNESPDPPSAVAPGLPDAVDEMVLRALATDRADRYDSVLYLRDDIEEIVQSL